MAVPRPSARLIAAQASQLISEWLDNDNNDGDSDYEDSSDYEDYYYCYFCSTMFYEIHESISDCPFLIYVLCVGLESQFFIYDYP